MSDDFEILTFGNEAEPLVVIDDFFSDLEWLRRLAAQSEFGITSPHYPGIRAQADPNYLGERMQTLRTVLTKVFGMGQGASMVECAFSIVTTPPTELKPIQRLPHFDTTDPKRLALLHYLSPDETGGTAFYRHAATGFEIVPPDRLELYSKAVQDEVSADGPPPYEYFRGQTSRFERIGHVEAKPNRMVIYRSYRLHSGDIPSDLPLLADPATGRLTLNTFLQGR
ncbi:MAG: DUF6445 family protein [Pseudomonadota bacterium]